MATATAMPTPELASIVGMAPAGTLAVMSAYEVTAPTVSSSSSPPADVPR